MTDSGIRLVINGTFVIHPEDRVAFANIVATVVRASREEAGCLGYSVAQDLLDANVFHLVEAWESQSALDRHLRDALFLRRQAEISTLRVLSSVVRQWSVSGETTPVIADGPSTPE